MMHYLCADEAKCCGAGQCVLVAPEVFDQRDEDGAVVLLDPAPAPPHHPTVREAGGGLPGGGDHPRRGEVIRSAGRPRTEGGPARVANRDRV